MKNKSREIIFKTALDTSDFRLIEPFKSCGSWFSWTSSERELFAIAVLREQLDSDIVDINDRLCSLAISVSPLSYVVNFLRAQIHWKVYRFSKSYSHLKKSIDSMFECLKRGGLNIMSIKQLVNIGIELLSYNHHVNIDDVSVVAICDVVSSVLDKFDDLELDGLLGIYYSLLGQMSGDPGDFVISVSKFSCAMKKGETSSRIKIKYLECLTSFLSVHYSDKIINEAHNIIETSLKRYEDNSFVLFQVAKLNSILFFYNGHDSNLLAADQAFSSCSLSNQLDQEIVAWNWAQLYWFVANVRRQVYFLRIANEKLVSFVENNTQNNHILALYATCQSYLGLQDEDYSQISFATSILKDVVSVSNDPAHHYALACSYVNMSKYLLDANCLKRAIVVLCDFLGENDSDPIIYLGLARVCFLIGESFNCPVFFKKSVSFFAKAERSISCCFWYLFDWAVALTRVGELFSDKNALAEALNLYAMLIGKYQAISTSIDPEIIYNYGLALNIQGDLSLDESFYEKAIQVFSLGQSVDSDNVQVRLGLAHSLSHFASSSGDMKCLLKSMEHYEFLSEINPDDDLVWYDWGCCILDFVKSYQCNIEGEYQAMVSIESAQDKFMAAARLGNVNATYNLACIFCHKGDIELAIEFLEKAINNNGCPSPEEIMEEDMLSTLVNDSRFVALLAVLQSCDSDDEFEDVYKAGFLDDISSYLDML